MTKILWALFGCLICTSYHCNAKELNKVFTHEYNFIMLHLYGSDFYPFVFCIMLEPNDTLRLNLYSQWSVVDGIDTKKLIFDDFKNKRIFYDIYGKTDKVYNSYLLFNMDMVYKIDENAKKKYFELRNGSNLIITYVKIVGLFTKFQLYNDVDMIEFFGDRANKFKNIYPLHILSCEPTDDLKIITYTDSEP